MNVYEVFIVTTNSVTHFVLEATGIGAAIELALQHAKSLPQETALNVVIRCIAVNTTLEQYTAAVEPGEA